MMVVASGPGGGDSIVSRVTLKADEGLVRGGVVVVWIGPAFVQSSSKSSSWLFMESPGFGDCRPVDVERWGDVGGPGDMVGSEDVGSAVPAEVLVYTDLFFFSSSAVEVQ